MSLKQKLDQNTDALLIKIGKISDKHFHEKPDAETWSPAQVLEHLYRSEFGLTKLFSGETRKDPDRNTEQIIQKMRVQMLENDNKMEARGIILPGDDKKSKDELISNFRSLREKIAIMADQHDEKEVCTSFKHPVYGYMTREEWVHFNIFHTKRHMGQIDRILDRLREQI